MAMATLLGAQETPQIVDVDQLPFSVDMISDAVVMGNLKQEFGLGRTLQSVKVAQELASDAIYIYNNNRLHSALMYKTPCEVHDSL